MRISTKGRYALRAMTDLALQEQGYVPLKEIAARQEITVKYLEQIFARLGKAGLVVGMRGNAGGYMLAKPAAQYTIAEIIIACEGGIHPLECVENPAYCERSEGCKANAFWKGLYRVTRDYMNSCTLKDLIDGNIK